MPEAQDGRLTSLGLTTGICSPLILTLDNLMQDFNYAYADF